MHPPVLASESQPTEILSLVIDKEGRLGKALLPKLSEIGTPVFVSKLSPDASSNVVHIPFASTIPQIPEGKYAYLFVVWSRDVKDMIEPLITKAQTDHSKLLLVTTKEQSKQVHDFLPTIPKEVVVLILGDVFGTLDSQSFLDTWVHQSKKTRKIMLPNMGLSIFYPILWDDVVGAILTAAFTKQSNPLCILSSRHPYTQLALAHALQKIDPDIQIDFERGTQSPIEMPEGEYIFHEYPVLEKVKQVYKACHVGDEFTPKEEGSVVFARPAYVLPKPRPQAYQPLAEKGWWFVYVLIVFILTPLVATLVCGLIGGDFLQNSVLSAESGNVSQAATSALAAKSMLLLTQESLGVVSFEAGLVGLGSRVAPLQRQVAVGSTLASSLHDCLSAVALIQGVLAGTSLRPQSDMELGVNTLKNAMIALQGVSRTDIPTSYQKQWDVVSSQLPLLENVADVLPDIIGATTDKTYLLLFQNNMELRPGGGFIGSYGLLSLHNGKIKDFSIHDVYEADGQLQGHVEPPFAIRRFIPLVHLYLRDSNFAVDSRENGQKAASLLQAETGVHVDGVLGIDLTFVKNLLAAMDNVVVGSYSETVTKDNFFLLTEKHAEKNFFAGSTQKKDFLQAFFVAMEQKLQERRGVSLSKLLEGVSTSLLQKDILFSFANPTQQDVFTVNGLSSALWDSRQESATGVVDFLGVNEANLGVNKVNYFIRRDVHQKVTIGEDGKVTEEVTLTLTNTSTGEWPGGDYKNYLRFILPQGATLTTVSLNGKVQSIVPAITDPHVYEAKGFVAPSGLEVEKTQDTNKQLFGFLVTTPHESTTTVTITYGLPHVVSLDGQSLTYSLMLFKQPGVESLPYHLDIVYPQSFSLLQSSQKFTDNQGTLSWANTLLSDTPLTVSFTKK